MNLYNTNSIPLGLIYLQLNYWKLTYKESENYEGSGDASKMIKNDEILKGYAYCSPPGLLTFWNFNKNQKTGHFHHYSHPLHNFQPYPQEDVNSETKVMVVSLLHLGKIYQADWKFSVLSSCRFLVVNFRKKFEEELEISRRQNLKGPGDINNLQLQDVQGIHYLIPKVV